MVPHLLHTRASARLPSSGWCEPLTFPHAAWHGVASVRAESCQAITQTIPIELPLSESLPKTRKTEGLRKHGKLTPPKSCFLVEIPPHRGHQAEDLTEALLKIGVWAGSLPFSAELNKCYFPNSASGRQVRHRILFGS